MQRSKLIVPKLKSVVVVVFQKVIGYVLLGVLFCSDHVFDKAYHLTSFLNHVSPLATGAFGC